VDPGRPPCYLAKNQIAEADLVVATKADLYPDAALVADYRVSSQTGDGVESWLDDILSGRRVAGSRLIEVDYDLYATEEAALGWVNLHADLHLRVAASPASVVGPLLDDLDESLAEITHLKVFDRAAGGYIKAAICGKGQEPAVEGDLLADSSWEHELVINLRAAADPEALHRAILRALKRIEGRVEFRYSKAFRPGYPRPEHRFTSVAP
jgi:hypothetical protein